MRRPTSSWDFEDLRPFLDHYGVRYYERESWQKIPCPSAGHVDSNPSCSLNLSYGYMDCHACEFSGGAVALVMDREGLEYEAARSFAEGIAGGGNKGFRGGSSRRGPGRPGTGYRPRLRGDRLPEE